MPTQHPQSTTPQTFTSQTPPQPQYYYFRGHKKRLSQLNKTKMLKTKRVKEKEHKVLRYDNDEEEFFEVDGERIQEGEGRREETSRGDTSQRRVKSQFQIMKLSPTHKLQRMRRNKSSTDNHQLMVRTSRMQITPVDTARYGNNFQKHLPSTSLPPSSNEQPHITKFYSKNLQERMNQYLNMVVAKSSQDHNEKVRRMREQEERGGVGERVSHSNRDRETKIFMKNKFLRELKTRTNLIKKNHTGITNNNSTQQATNTPRLAAQTSRTSHNPPTNTSQQFSHSRIKSHHHSIHNHSTGNNKMAEGEELINFASEVLSKSMKVYGSARGRAKENSVKRLNCSVQVVGNR